MNREKFKVYYYYYRNKLMIRKYLHKGIITKEDYIHLHEYNDYAKNKNDYIPMLIYMLKDECEPFGIDYMHGECPGEDEIMGVGPIMGKSSIYINVPRCEYNKCEKPDPYFKVVKYDDEDNIVSIARINMMKNSYILHEKSVCPYWFLTNEEKISLIKILTGYGYSSRRITWECIIDKYNDILEYFIGDEVCKKYGYYIPSDLPMPDYLELK